MDATYIQEQIKQLKNDIYRHVQHKTLLEYTGYPLVNEHQLFYMLLPFFNGDEWDDLRYEGIITVGIVQASLNKHGLIDECDATSKIQQLTVLSGDYYSGRYYEILANSGNISLIQQLSEGVVKRSEHEIRVYEDRHYSLDDWLESLRVIETEFITRFYKLYHYSEYTSVMQTALLINRLQNELLNYKKGNSSLYFQKMIENFGSDRLEFEHYIQKEIDHLADKLKDSLQSVVLKDALRLFIDDLLFSQKLERS